MIRIHSTLPKSNVNGPGKRFVIWTQGCGKRCTGCFNPQMQELTGGSLISPDNLFLQISAVHGITGISISGGEPFLQISEITKLIMNIKKLTDLSVLIYTGFSIEEIMQESESKLSLDFIDVLIAGPYIHDRKNSGSLASSTNQHIHLITDKYCIGDFNIPESEIIIDQNGKIIITGIKPVKFNNKKIRKTTKNEHGV